MFRCTGITDSGISAVARGCPGLEMINIAYCKDITDSSLISLSKCSSLNTVESRGCPLITSLGLAAIAVGCKQLVKLDIKKCINIDDAGMIPLAHFSQNLRQVPFVIPFAFRIALTVQQMITFSLPNLSSCVCRLICRILLLRMWGCSP